MAPVSSDEGARSTAPPTDSEKGTTGAEAGEDVRFSPDQEATLVAESAAQRATANALFGSGEYDSAIKEYDAAVSTCPNYLDYDLAVLRSNISACHLKLNAWKDAIAAATAALDKLDMLDGTERRKEDEAASDTAAEADVEEIVSPEAARIASTAPLDSQGHTAAQVQKLRIKALLRRAKARSELQGWSALEGAMEDYKTLSALPGLSPQDAKVVQRALVTLPPRAKAAQETETAEMMGKLKELGNGLLKPFGLSTDSFNLAKDASGGYSVNFGK